MKKPNGYWNEFENLKKEMAPIIEDCIKNKKPLPSNAKLKEMGKSYLSSAIIEHGGLYEFYKKMGYNYRRKRGYWKKIDNVMVELKPIIEKSLKDNNRLPTLDEIEKTHSSLSASISNHGGISTVIKKMGYEPNMKSYGYWKSFENLESELRPIAEKFLKEKKRLPKSDEIRKLDCGITSSFKYHGGIKNVFERMGYLPTKSKESFINFIEKEGNAKQVIERFGGSKADVADILAVIYEDRIQKNDIDDLQDLLYSPSLSDYLGRFVKSNGGIGDLVEIGTHILPFDKGDVIKDIIYRRAQENRREKLGNRPSDDKMDSYLTELSRELQKLDSIEPKPHETIIKEMVARLSDDTKKLFEMYKNGIEGLSCRVKNPEFENGAYHV